MVNQDLRERHQYQNPRACGGVYDGHGRWQMRTEPAAEQEGARDIAEEALPKPAAKPMETCNCQSFSVNAAPEKPAPSSNSPKPKTVRGPERSNSRPTNGEATPVASAARE